MKSFKHILKACIFGVLSQTPLKYIVVRWNAGCSRRMRNAEYEQKKAIRKQRIGGQLEKLRKRVADGQPVRVAFLVYTRQMFSLRTLFEAMCEDPAFAPCIIPIPLYPYGKEKMIATLHETYEEMHAQYGDKVYPVFDGSYDLEAGSFPDFSGMYDVCAFSTPYEDSHPLFHIEHWSEKCLCIYSEYGYGGTSMLGTASYRRPTRALIWRIFTHNQSECGLIDDDNAVLCGCSTNDMFAKVTRRPCARKRIILAPHHSLPGWANQLLQLSTFLTHAEFFLQLPKLYPDVDFIFRPHPFLIPKLESDHYWGKARTDAWLAAFLGNPNVTMNMDGNHADLMVNSDAIINDCNSFMTDYFYTDKPQCYLVRKHVDYRCYLTDFGMQIFNHTYHAKTSKGIRAFIEKVVIQGQDPKKEKRTAFADAHIKIGYPNVHTHILNHLKAEFGIK